MSQAPSFASPSTPFVAPNLCVIPAKAGIQKSGDAHARPCHDGTKAERES
jgi:hypothetical protein